MKNKVIVTGGAGFIGSHLVEKLIGLKYKVSVIDNFSNGKIKNLNNVIKNKNLKVYKYDLNQKSKIEKIFKDCIYVFHLASLADIVPSIENPKNYFESNVMATLNVLELCRKFKIKKIIYAASSSCYGISNKVPFTEKSKINCQYPYALTKFNGEELIVHWSKFYGIKYMSLRLFNVYGPRSRTSGTYGAVFGVFLAQKLANKPFTVVGDGKQKRDFIFVSDVVDAFIKAAKTKHFDKIINIGFGKSNSINYLTKLLGGQKVFIPKRPGEPIETIANIAYAKKILKWKPRITFENGVKIMVKNINYWLDAPLWNKQNISKATKNWFKYLN